MNTVFKRQSLPNAEGLDILSFGTLEDILTAIGDPIQEPVTDEESKKTTYEFESLQVVVDEQGAVEEVTARFEQGVTPSVVYRYDRVDGTMPYEVIKRYFGEAEHDYTEQPTNIRVLHYDRLGRTAETTFVFSADNDLLITIRYSL